MSQCRGYYLLLLATFLAGVPSVKSKSVCIGETILLFQNLTFGSLKTTVYLYKTSSSARQLVASWSNPKSDNDPPPKEHYKKRLLFDDKGGNITLEHFLRSDEAKYVLQYDIHEVNMTQEVEIVALVAPNESCRPKIQFESTNVLSASLEDKSCGKPSAFVQWKDSPGISRKIGPAVKLHPGKEAGTYYACLDGPALTCVNNTMQYCSNFTIAEDCSRPIIAEKSEQKTDIYMMVTILAVVIIFTIIPVVVLCCKYKKIKYNLLQRDAIDHQQAEQTEF